ncbi:MAG: DUF6702 family protein [Pseudomonadota bacterium]
MARLMLCAMLVSLLVGTPPLAAHQQKEAVTRILFNERTGNIEVMHRFLLHDAEHAIQSVLGPGADLLGSAADREQFEAYVATRFSLMDPAGEPLALTRVGNEVDGPHLWVYSEAPIPDELTALTIIHDALRDVWPEQANLVNIERAGEVRSALLRSERQKATIRF